MRLVTLFAAAALVVVLGAAPAAASGWLDYYDCGNGVVPIFGGWHGKTWLTIEGNHKLILDEGVFQNAGTVENEVPFKFNADQTDFSFRVKWHGKTMILRYHNDEHAREVTFDGHACRSMGDSRYEGEAQNYEEGKNK
jgi:hypothetical protein